MLREVIKALDFIGCCTPLSQLLPVLLRRISLEKKVEKFENIFLIENKVIFDTS
jgi:hypothetical protein